MNLNPENLQEGVTVKKCPLSKVPSGHFNWGHFILGNLAYLPMLP